MQRLTCSDYTHVLLHFVHEAMGVAETPGIPCALSRLRAACQQLRRDSVPRERVVVFERKPMSKMKRTSAFLAAAKSPTNREYLDHLPIDIRGGSVPICRCRIYAEVESRQRHAFRDCGDF